MKNVIIIFFFLLCGMNLHSQNLNRDLSQEVDSCKERIIKLERIIKSIEKQIRIIRGFEEEKFTRLPFYDPNKETTWIIMDGLIHDSIIKEKSLKKLSPFEIGF